MENLKKYTLSSVKDSSDKRKRYGMKIEEKSIWSKASMKNLVCKVRKVFGNAWIF